MIAALVSLRTRRWLGARHRVRNPIDLDDFGARVRYRLFLMARTRTAKVRARNATSSTLAMPGAVTECEGPYGRARAGNTRRAV